jgi:hypothetical protein
MISTTPPKSIGADGAELARTPAAEVTEREPLPQERFTNLTRELFTGPEDEIQDRMAEINDLCEEQELDFFTEIRALGDTIYEENWFDDPNTSIRPFEVKFLRSMRETDPQQLRYLQDNLVDVLDNYEDSPQRTLGIYPVPFIDALIMTAGEEDELKEAAARLYARSSGFPDSKRRFATQIAVKAGVPEAVESQVRMAQGPQTKSKSEAIKLLAKSSSEKARDEVRVQISQQNWKGEGERKDIEEALTNLALNDPDLAEPLILKQIRERLDTYEELKTHHTDERDDYAVRQALERKTGSWSPNGHEPKTIVTSDIYAALAALGTSKAME